MSGRNKLESKQLRRKIRAFRKKTSMAMETHSSFWAKTVDKYGNPVYKHIHLPRSSR